MIPEKVEKWIFPELALPEEDLPKVELPCGGIGLKFIIGTDDGDVDLTWDEFDSWDVSLADLAETAGINAFSYNTWEAVADEVYENADDCWPSLVLAPVSYLEHNYVSGRHVIYIVDERTAILTGDQCEQGLERIRSVLEGGLADAPMIINPDRRTWSRYDLDRPPN